MKLKTIRWLKYGGTGVVVITIVVFWSTMGMMYLSPQDYPCTTGSNVAIVKLYGDLDFVDNPDGTIALGDEIAQEIDRFSKESDIEVIILDTYSFGGLASAGEAVAEALKRSPKKTIAMVREDALSAAYLAVSGADKIYVNRLGQVGSIGITMSYLDDTEKKAQEGVRYVSLTSAPYKDLYSMERPLSALERQKISNMLSGLHKTLVQMIAENRNMPVESVQKLADGSIFSAQEALDNGLVDTIGDINTVFEDLRKEDIEPRMCQ